jgi:hypothetical protein
MFSKLSVIFVAALAAAGEAHNHRRQYANETADPASASMTTSTVYSTQEITITSCAPTVTNCPAKSISVLTSVVAVSTTVVPVKATASPSSSVVAAALGGSSSVPLGTAPAGSSPSASSIEVGGSSAPVTTRVSNATLTYTLGLGSSSTVITTTVHRTSTETLYSVSILQSDH